MKNRNDQQQFHTFYSLSKIQGQSLIVDQYHFACKIIQYSQSFWIKYFKRRNIKMLEYINIACNINTRKTRNKVIYDEVIIQWHVFERYILYLDLQTRNERMLMQLTLKKNLSNRSLRLHYYFPNSKQPVNMNIGLSFDTIFSRSVSQVYDIILTVCRYRVF